MATKTKANGALVVLVIAGLIATFGSHVLQPQTKSHPNGRKTPAVQATQTSDSHVLELRAEWEPREIQSPHTVSVHWYIGQDSGREDISSSHQPTGVWIKTIHGYNNRDLVGVNVTSLAATVGQAKTAIVTCEILVDYHQEDHRQAHGYEYHDAPAANCQYPQRR
jgi:hypothetical protein